MTSRVWTGAAPVWEVISEPIPKKTNTVKTNTLRALPDYMDSFVRQENETNEKDANEVEIK